ncbi:glycoside hydrolase family 26 protein [Nocardiopsis changdeensis]|nr:MULTISPECIES: glycosyl hydrolase [Nocardiopsis]
MDSGPVRVMASMGAVLLTLTLTGADGGGPTGQTGQAEAPRRSFTAPMLGLPSGAEYRCTVSEILEPSCGVWWGGSPHEGDVAQLEEAAGRRMDIVYTWRGIDQAQVPGERERRLVAEGRFVHTNIEARRFTRPGHPDVSYRSILAGEFDGVLRDQARAVAALEAPYFLTFDHEADANKRYNKRGTPQEFTRAWRHIVDLYEEEGADNAIWVWNVTGWRDNLDRLPGLWPGNEYVDWISWEAYNMTGCDLMPGWDHVDSFEDALRPAYEWIQNEGPKHGIDPAKPVMIGEMGTTFIGARETLEWYADVPRVLPEYERIRAVKVWDSKVSEGCDFRLGVNRYAQQGFEMAGRDPYVNMPDRVRRLVEYAHRD